MLEHKNACFFAKAYKNDSFLGNYVHVAADKNWR